MALQVIGAGLGRTGTLSLKFALEHLGFGKCHHMVEVLTAGEERLPHWMGVINGDRNWGAVFSGFSATVDYPSCAYWHELADYYPEAKVILTTRDAQDWFTSINRTILSPEAVENMRSGPLAHFMNGIVLKDFGDNVHDRDFMVDYFQRWEANVVAALSPERLLIHRPGDGWEPLCAFLDVPVPDFPYPRVNTSEDMRAQNVDRDAALDPADAQAGLRAYMQDMWDKAFKS